MPGRTTVLQIVDVTVFASRTQATKSLHSSGSVNFNQDSQFEQSLSSQPGVARFLAVLFKIKSPKQGLTSQKARKQTTAPHASAKSETKPHKARKGRPVNVDVHHSGCQVLDPAQTSDFRNPRGSKGRTSDTSGSEQSSQLSKMACLPRQNQHYLN